MDDAGGSWGGGMEAESAVRVLHSSCTEAQSRPGSVGLA